MLATRGSLKISTQTWEMCVRSADLHPPVTGMRFYDLVEAVREGLRKQVDVLNYEQLKDNPDLVNEILKDGIKIYG